MEKKYYLKHPLILLLTVFFSGYSASQAFLEEVIVTTEKRTESVQDVSQAVTAIASSELSLIHI